MDEKTTKVEKANKKLDFHKVFAAIGIVLIVTTIIGAGVWYMVQSAEGKAGSTGGDTNIVKVTTSSAKMKTATTTASSSAKN